MYLEILGRTECGLVRAGNEDGILLARKGHPPKFWEGFHLKVEIDDLPVLVAVADGMGGVGAGEVATDEMLRFLALQFETLVEDEDVPAQLIRMAKVTNDHLWEICHQPKMLGSGSTLTAAFLFRGNVFFLQVGDSCAYGFRQGELRRLVTIQNNIEYFRAMGFAFREFHGPCFPALIGSEQTVEPELIEVSVLAGDIFFLCTDGLLPYDEDGDFDSWIPEVMRSSRNLVEIEQRLFEHAEQDGFRDNASSILVKISDSPDL